jgi:hypothetical protein
MSYEIPGKFRHSLTDSLCLTPTKNSVLQNIALKDRCFQQNTVLRLCLQLSTSNGTSQWSVAFFSAAKVTITLTSLTQNVRLETGVASRSVFSSPVSIYCVD